MTLYFVMTLLGPFVIVCGIDDILVAFMAHGAKASWIRSNAGATGEVATADA